MSKLCIMVGIPGSGKSTYIKNYASENAKIVSRDNIRFSLLKEGNKYFSKEKEVLKILYATVNDYLRQEYDVYVDATHITKRSRHKLLSNLNLNKDIQTIAIHIKTPLSHALKNNHNRIGTQYYVPPEVIKKFYDMAEPPTLEEGFDKIFSIEFND